MYYNERNKLPLHSHKWKRSGTNFFQVFSAIILALGFAALVVAAAGGLLYGAASIVSSAWHSSK